jgi:hypothetical protein
MRAAAPLTSLTGRRLMISYAILADALEQERNCSPDLSDDHFDFFQLTLIGCRGTFSSGLLWRGA